MSNEINKESDRQNMLERGEFVANGYKFVVKPICLGEEDEYLEDVPYVLYPQMKEGKDPTDKDLSRYAIALFRNPSGSDDEKSLGFIERIKLWFHKKFSRDYKYYSDNPSVLGLVKWIEKKVYYNGKHIRFYDLERKYGLNKTEIVKLFGFFQDMSGF